MPADRYLYIYHLHLRITGLVGCVHGPELQILENTMFWKQTQFLKVVFSGYLHFQKMDEAHKPTDSECYKPPWELFRFYPVNRVRRFLSNVSK
jgi:hypothetical protein